MKTTKIFTAAIIAGSMIFSQPIFADDIRNIEQPSAEDTGIYLSDLNAAQIFADYCSKDIKSMTMDMKGTLSANITTDDENYSMITNISGKAKEIIDLENIGNTIMSMDMNMNMDINGANEIEPNDIPKNMDMSYSMYYKDNYMYINMLGEQTKMKIPFEEALKQIEQLQIGGDSFGIENLKNINSELAKNFTKDIKVKSFSNGTKELSYSIDLEKAANLIFDKVIGNFGKLGGSVATDGFGSYMSEMLKNAISIDNMKTTVILDENNYPKSETTIYSMAININPEFKINYDVNMTSDISDINKTEITLPDLSNYTDISDTSSSMGIINGSDGPTSTFTN